MALDYINPQGINSYQNPLQTDGQLIHAVNCINFPFGGLSKRPGYTSFLGTADGQQVNTLSAFPNQDGTTLFLYRASGSTLYYSQQGTGAWTVAQGSAGGDSGGTITNNAHLGAAITNNVFICGDGAGSTRHTTNGTQFTNTVLAPTGQYFAPYQGRIYTTQGTTSTVSFSVTNDATNWNIGGTSDSSSFTAPGEGAASQLFVAGDRLNVTKTRGAMYNWDGQTLTDMSTRYGASSPWSITNIDDTWYWINQYGQFSYDGANKTLISNPVQRQFYNQANTGIQPSSWGTAPAVSHIWDTLVAIGTVTDDFTGRTIPNAILKYDFQKQQYLNWQFTDAPTAFLSYFDQNKQRQLLFGNSSGQCFQMNATKTSDNGAPIETEMVFLFTYASQQSTFTQTSSSTISAANYEKKWDWIRLFFNTGDEVNIQYAFSNSLTYQHLKWSEALNTRNQGSPNDYWQVSDGVVEIRFPLDLNNQPRSRFLFVRIYDNSDSSQWSYYGCQISATPQLIL